MPQEIELKLEVAPESLGKLLKSGLLNGDCSESSLHAVYFDTAAYDLRDLGHSLRIRAGNGKSVQTIKSGGGTAGLFTRGEWELPVSSGKPVEDGRTPVSDLLANRLGELRPVFEVPAQRRRYVVENGKSRIEAAIDEAEASVGERSERFCEVELELLEGPSDALFALARKIDAIAPVRIGVLSKADRGYRLLGPLPTSAKAEKLLLDPEMDIPTAFSTLAGSCLRQYRLNEAILLDRYVPEAVHQARIGIRRLRTAMVLFKPLVGGVERDALNARLRELAACLGEARDLDVLFQTASSSPLLDRLSAARDLAHAAVEDKLSEEGTRLLMLDLSEWITQGAWRRDPHTKALRESALLKFAAEALDRRRRKVVKHGRHLVSLSPADRHNLRKDAKKLRYSVEFLSSLFGHKKRRSAFRKALSELQDHLGAINDHAAAKTRLESLGLVDTPGAEAFFAAEPIEDELSKAAAARHTLLDAKPFWQ